MLLLSASAVVYSTSYPGRSDVGADGKRACTRLRCCQYTASSNYSRFIVTHFFPEGPCRGQVHLEGDGQHLDGQAYGTTCPLAGIHESCKRGVWCLGDFELGLELLQLGE